MTPFHPIDQARPTLSRVELPSHPLESYEGLIDHSLFVDIQGLADALCRQTVLHVNATPTGGGVAELLRSVVPLMNGLGLSTHWYHLEPNVPFFHVTKHVHNALQGAPWAFDDDARELFLAQSRRLAEAIAEIQADLVIIHDPQPCFAMAGRRGGGKILWHCHIDTSTPNPAVWEFFRAGVQCYDRWVFCQPDYVNGSLPADRVRFIRPAIDPFSPKNRPMGSFEAKVRLAGVGIDLDRPLVTQVSRFDPWKDPRGVIDAYRLAKRRIPGLQLALVGVMAAQDDPEAAHVLAEVEAYRDGDADIHLFSDPAQVGDLEVNAFQRGSDVIVQKSLREGFGLTVAEALWKGTPVIGGNCGGIRLQIESGRNGYLVDSSAQCADLLVSLLRDETHRIRLGLRGREVVRREFLTPRLLRDYLEVFRELLDEGRTRPRQAEALSPCIDDERAA